MWGRAQLANRVAPTLQDESISEKIEDGTKKGLMALGLEEETANKAAPWLSILPEFLPGVGGVVGADNTRKHISDGNYGMAALEGGLTVAGEAFPVIGDLAKWAILAPAAKKYGGKSVENMEDVAHSTLGGAQLKPNAIKKIEVTTECLSKFASQCHRHSVEVWRAVTHPPVSTYYPLVRILLTKHVNLVY